MRQKINTIIGLFIFLIAYSIAFAKTGLENLTPPVQSDNYLLAANPSLLNTGNTPLNYLMGALANNYNTIFNRLGYKKLPINQRSNFITVSPLSTTEPVGLSATTSPFSNVNVGYTVDTESFLVVFSTDLFPTKKDSLDQWTESISHSKEASWESFMKSFH